MSYSETFQPFRAGEACALTTGLGSVSFVSFDIHRLPSGRLVSQHSPELGPACVQNRFRHSGFSKLGRVHIADDDQTVSVSQFCAGDMKVMPARVGDLCRNGAGAFLVSGALGLPKGDLVLSVVTNGRDFDAIAACGKRLEPEVNTDLSVSDREIILNLALESHVPATAGVLHERSGLELSFNFSGFPEPEPTLEVDGSITVKFEGTRHERNKAKSPLGPKAGTEPRASTMCVSRGNELTARSCNCVRMQAEFSGDTDAKLYQIERGRPADFTSTVSATFSLSLSGNTKVPDLIASDSVPGKMLSSCGVLDAKFKCDNAHFGAVLRQSGRVKSASSACKPSARSLFIPFVSTSNKGAGRSALSKETGE